jgi:hypothetical protein
MSQSLTLDDVQRDVLAHELDVLVRRLPDEAARAPYLRLRAAIETGEVPEDLFGHLENLIELALQTGRARRFHRAEGEQALIRLFHRTPHGRTAAEQVQTLNAALAALGGQVIDSVQVSASAPGSYSITVDTDRCVLTIKVDRTGARVESMAIGV